MGKNLKPSTRYHPQTDGKIERVNQWLEGYLRNYVGEQQKTWAKWLHLGEFFYDTTFHMSIAMSPFKELYGYGSLTFVEIIFGDSRAPKSKYWVEESKEIFNILKDNLQVSQNQQKKYVDSRREERTFQVNDLVYLRLKPYKQTSLKNNGAENLKPRYYGPYKVVPKIGEVAYELEIMEGSKIHNAFHVYCLKKFLGQQIVT